MGDLVTIRRALISVSDKTNLVEFARALASRGVEIVSTGGTLRALQGAGVNAIPVEELTGLAEMMDGRVKTLHPAVHGAILARRDSSTHMEALASMGGAPIDLVCVNLYPFERTVSSESVPEAEAIEQIDVGGPCMLRAAAKNFDAVTVVSEPAQYPRVIDELEANGGATTRALRMDLASEAFGRTSAYDAAIVAWMNGQRDATFPDVLTLRYEKVQNLRYGENPHQAAALYRDPSFSGASVVGAEPLHGKALSYNNIADAAAAMAVVEDLARVDPGNAACVVIKHTNPCGAACAPTVAEAAQGALAGDPLAAFGGILAASRRIDLRAAQRMTGDDLFLEVVLAPGFDDDALELLRARWKTVRLLAVGDLSPDAPRPVTLRSVPGGALAQEADALPTDPASWTLGAGEPPSRERLREASIIWTVARHLSSNAIAIGGRDGPCVRLFGAGSGLVDRVTACRVALEKAGDRAKGAIAASDAFFPFADGPALLIAAGVRTLVQPGGSKRDAETLELCRDRQTTCLLTGVRHFRH